MSRNLGGEPTGPTQKAGEPGQPGMRKEVGGADSSRLHPPYVSESVESAPMQEETSSPGAIPTLPANAHGVDRSEMTEQPPIREESMYEQRPGENKDTPPSTTGGR
ncbi:MAG TPA: hypothetical protein VHG28_14735 [Longimicrobiaceae bacterium]|nr:hypothetical protein [Longimicrobiaceae bacterium]